MNKYHARKIVIDGEQFDSIKEAKRYHELKLLEHSGEISELSRQPKFELQPKFKCRGEHYRAITYKADFRYVETLSGDVVIEDVKGFKTRDYMIKKKLFLFKYGHIYKFLET